MADNQVIRNIPLAEYHKQNDETLYEILVYFGGMYEDSLNGNPPPRYRYVYELLQLRQTEKLVFETFKMANRTKNVAIATWFLVAAAFITQYLSK